MTELAHPRSIHRRKPLHHTWYLVFILTLTFVLSSHSVFEDCSGSSLGGSGVISEISEFSVQTLPAPPPEPKCYSLWTLSGSSIRCQKPANGISEQEIPFVLGIGPAKTGSTVLFSVLDRLPSVLVGNASLGGRPCCTYELYFFTSPNKIELNNILRFYPKDSLHQATWLAEKTPIYSSSLVAPYRVRAMLTEPKLKLIFTYREPLSAFFSYFSHFNEQEWTMPIFIAWTSNALELYREYKRCVYILARHAGFSDAFHTTVPPTWVGVQHFDELAYVKCQMPIHEKSERDMINFFSIYMYIYTHSITRWKRVLPNAEMVCTEHEALLARPAEHANGMLAWLGLGQDYRSIDLVSQFGRSNPNSLEKFMATAKGNEKQVVNELHAQLKVVFEGQLEYARTVCHFLI